MACHREAVGMHEGDVQPAHRFGCTYDEHGILSRNCPGCLFLSENPSMMDSRFEGILQVLNSPCEHCGGTVSITITGLYPYGIAFRCRCMETISNLFNGGRL